MKTFDVDNFRRNFPILTQQVEGAKLVYFDNAATMQKPFSVIEAERQFYMASNANVHRAAHALSAQATGLFEQARTKVQTLINARLTKEIIWTKGTTESINLIAQTWGSEYLKSGDEIVLSYAEHHANIVPWQAVAEKTGAKLVVLPLNEQGLIDIEQLQRFISAKAKIVCCSHLSNVVGKFNPVVQIIARAKQVGALTLIDGAQAISHTQVDVQALDCDFYVFSAHKFYGPTGVGVLYGKEELLNKLTPYQFGGEMIKTVSFNATTYNELPFKFEAGTPNIAGCVAFGEAIDFINGYQQTALYQHKRQLTQYCYQQLAAISSVRFVVQEAPDIPLFSFYLDNLHQQDVAAALDTKGIAIRAGHHCAMPLMEYLKLSGCLRVSLSAYNTKEEIDVLIKSLQQIIHEHLQSAKINNDQAMNPQGLPLDDTTQQILALFAKHRSWESKHRQIMLLGKSLSRMDKALRTESRLITGCESAAWLDIKQTPDGTFIIQGDSDAKIIRGLMAIVFSAFNKKCAEQILAFDIQQYFEQLGLVKHLSPSRGNGLLAIVEKIKSSVADSD